MKPKMRHTPLNILLADDDKDEYFLFEKALEELSVLTHLKTVSNGEELINYLTENTEHLPDVIFLDLNMPRINGSECLLKIKGNKKLKHLPVIIYSTSLRDESVDELYKNGAHYYLHKSNFAELPECIRKVLAMVTKNPNQPSRDEFIIG